MATAHDVAAYILAKNGSMSAMKLQKLCYYSQAWSLVWDEAPMFRERIEAWANGPVIPDLYAKHRGAYTVSTWPSGEPSQLTQDQQDTVDAVVRAYGDLTAQQLSELTHREPPWRDARSTLPETVRSNSEVTTDSMQRFYSSLAQRQDSEPV